MALITLHNVTLGFGNAPVLENISLSIEPGARACVTGRNGEGKSTLLKVLAGVLEPDSGEVLRQNGLRVAYLPQDVPEDRPGTVRENLLQAITPADCAAASSSAAPWPRSRIYCSLMSPPTTSTSPPSAG